MTQTKNKTTKKYLDIINSGIITERQIIDIRSFLNNNPEERSVIFDTIHEREGLNISPEQNEKGYKFLISQWKTPRGIERKNNPFGYREQEILRHFTHFTLKSFYDNSRYGMDAYWLSLYECHSKDNSFEYYYDGEIHIIG